MCRESCAAFWDRADHFPVLDAIKYWCDGSLTCIEARTNALLSAMERGEVKYRRRDGKSFQDSVYQLEASNSLLVERESFLAWSKEVSDEAERHSLLDTVAVGARAETSFNHIIGALVQLMLDKSPGGTPYSVFTTQTAIIEQLETHFPNVQGISKRTLEDKFKKGKDSLGKR